MKTKEGTIESPVSSGITPIWSLWRHCLCRSGLYPLFVTPFIVVGAGLSLYSTGDCQFLKVDVGFEPANEAWNASSTVPSGLFFYQSYESYDFPWNRTYIHGCRPYSDKFEEYFVQNDRVWRVARTGSLVGGLSGVVAVVIVVLLSICPLPTCFIWPGMLLPAVIASMFSEATKFLILDSDICKSRVWIPSDNRSFGPTAASSCTLDRGAYVSFATIGVYFLCIVLICLRSPSKRRLDPNYGRTKTKGKRQEKYLDLEKQDTIVMSEGDEHDQSDHTERNEAEKPSHPALSLSRSERQLVTQRDATLDEATPRMVNSSSTDIQAKRKDAHDPLQKSFSFNKGSWVEFESDEGESKDSSKSALYALKKQREQGSKRDESRNIKRVSMLQKKKSSAAEASSATNQSGETALVVFNPKPDQSEEAYSNYSVSVRNHGEDAYSNYSVAGSNNGDDGYSNYSLPASTRSVDVLPEVETSRVAIYHAQGSEGGSRSIPPRPTLMQVPTSGAKNAGQSHQLVHATQSRREESAPKDKNITSAQVGGKQDPKTDGAPVSRRQGADRSLRDGYFRVY